DHSAAPPAPSHIVVLLLFHEAVAHRDLRSFPTRRSSDLVRSTAREELNAAAVQTISESQADLGTHSPSLQAVSADRGGMRAQVRDRKSTRLNSSHVAISYAVFCLKKKTHQPLLPCPHPPC